MRYTNALNALIVDDHPLIRRAIMQMFTEAFGRVNFAEEEDCERVISRVRRQLWDIIVLDIGLRGGNGLTCLMEIRHIVPEAKVLVVSGLPESEYAVPALRAGASGFLGKDRASEELVRAVERILSGGRYVSLEVADRFASVIFEGGEVQPHERLSQREFQVMLCLAGGQSIKEISEELSLSDRTISTYRARLLEKMCLKSNTDLTEYCLRKGLWSGSSH